MQTPTVYIIALMTIFITFILIKEKNYLIFRQLLIGLGIVIIFLILYLLITNTSAKDLFYQYFLFPITIAESRISSDADAYVKLIDQLNFKRIFGDFKFIHIFLIPLIYFQLLKLKSKKIDKIFFISILFILSTILFIYNQLLQANQIYIFSLIPILAALVQKNINFNTNSKNYSSFILIVLILFISLKFHFRYNVDRKFIDLENIDKTQAINAQDIHQNFNNLKWISRYSSPKEDKAFIKKVIQSLKNEDKNSYVITHYQFFSTILKKNFYILNRWYIWDNNSHPTESHKYFKYYKNFVLENFRKNSIIKL